MAASKDKEFAEIERRLKKCETYQLFFEHLKRTVAGFGVRVKAAEETISASVGSVSEILASVEAGEIQRAAKMDRLERKVGRYRKRLSSLVRSQGLRKENFVDIDSRLKLVENTVALAEPLDLEAIDGRADQTMRSVNFLLRERLQVRSAPWYTRLKWTLFGMPDVEPLGLPKSSPFVLKQRVRHKRTGSVGTVSRIDVSLADGNVWRNDIEIECSPGIHMAGGCSDFEVLANEGERPPTPPVGGMMKEGGKRNVGHSGGATDKPKAIVVVQSFKKYLACMADGRTGEGPSVQSAVGNLVVNHPDTFGVHVRVEPSTI